MIKHQKKLTFPMINLDFHQNICFRTVHGHLSQPLKPRFGPGKLHQVIRCAVAVQHRGLQGGGTGLEAAAKGEVTWEAWGGHWGHHGGKRWIYGENM